MVDASDHRLERGATTARRKVFAIRRPPRVGSPVVFDRVGGGIHAKHELSVIVAPHRVERKHVCHGTDVPVHVDRVDPRHATRRLARRSKLDEIERVALESGELLEHVARPWVRLYKVAVTESHGTTVKLNVDRRLHHPVEVHVLVGA